MIDWFRLFDFVQMALFCFIYFFAGRKYQLYKDMKNYEQYKNEILQEFVERAVKELGHDENK